MPELNQKIQKYINRSQVSIYQLAKNTNLDRTMIQKMIKGTKYPGFRFFVKFCDALMLNLDEREELINLFLIEKIGIKRYQTRTEVGNLLSVLQSMDNNYVNLYELPISIPQLPGKDGQASEIKGVQNVRLFAYAMLREQICECHAQDIYLDLCEWSDLLLKIIYHFKSLSSSPVQTHQHLVLSYISSENKSNSENILTMQKVLPSLFVLKKDYHLRYFYVNDIQDQKRFGTFPHYILGEDRLFLFNDSADRGISITDPVMIASYRQEIMRIESNSIKLVRYFGKDIDAKEVYYNIAADNRIIASYGLTPCVQFFAAAASYTDTSDQIMKKMFSKAADHQLDAMEDPDYIQIYGTAGMRRFIETGILPAPAGTFYQPVEKQKRMELIKEYEDFLSQSKSSYLLKESADMTENHSGLKVKLFAPNRILLSGGGVGIPHGMILLEENSTFENLLDYFQGLIEYERVYRPEEGAKEFRKKMDEYVSKL